ncbi:MAG: VWA domain-containing protein [Bryobacteraceae bacterium]
MGISFDRRCPVAPFALIVLAFALVAAQTPADRRQAPVFRSNSAMILVNALVVDRSERFVTDLKRDDFRVFQDGHEQKTVKVWLEETPVSAGIVLDASGSMKEVLPLAKQVAMEFIGSSNPNDEFFVITVGRRPAARLLFETRAEAVVRVVNNQQAEGSTALLDSIYLAVNYLHRSRNARKALLVISDGEDNHSRYSERELVRLLEESNLTLYTLGLGVRHTDHEDSEPAPGEHLLTVLAEATGGRYFEVSSKSDLPQAIAGINIRYQYMLGYGVEGVRNDGKYHRISLKLTGEARRRKLRAYYRPGYYAPEGVVGTTP